MKYINIRVSKSNDDIAVDFYLAEYKSLRNEINLYHQQQKQLMYFSLILIGSFLGFISTKIQWIKSNDIILLCIAPFFVILGLMFADKTVRIIRLAHYIDADLRNKIYDMINKEVLNWEVYKRKTKIIDKKNSENIRPDTLVHFYITSFLHTNIIFSYP